MKPLLLICPLILDITEQKDLPHQFDHFISKEMKNNYSQLPVCHPHLSMKSVIKHSSQPTHYCKDLRTDLQIQTHYFPQQSSAVMAGWKTGSQHQQMQGAWLSHAQTPPVPITPLPAMSFTNSQISTACVLRSGIPIIPLLKALSCICNTPAVSENTFLI